MYWGSPMWEIALVIIQVACLAILVAAAIVSLGLSGSAKGRLKRPHRG